MFLSKTRTTSRPLRRGSEGIYDCDFDLLRFDGQRQAAFGANLKAKRDCFFDVCQCLLARFPLADAAGDGGALGNPHAVFITVERRGEFHRSKDSTRPAFAYAPGAWLSKLLLTFFTKRRSENW